MKQNAIIRIVIFSVVAVLLIGLLITGILFARIPFLFFGHRAETHTDSYVQSVDGNDGGDRIIGGTVANAGSVAADQVSDLEIQWVGGSVTIVPGDTEKIEFSETGNDRKPMVWKQAGNKLLIQFSEHPHRVYFGYPFNDYSKDLVITVPKDWAARELKIDSVSADVNVSDLTITEVDMNSVSGAADFENCVVADYTGESVSGDVKFSGSLGKLDCNTVSGDCTIVTNQVPSEVSMECVSGDVDLTMPENSGFTVTLDSATGDLNSDFPVTKQGRSYSYGDGSCKIDVAGVSGNISIRKLAQ